MQRIPQSFFQKQAEVEAKQIELLKQLVLPKWERWKVDWKKIKEIGESEHKRRWSRLDVYNTLVKYKTKPAYYCMSVGEGLGLSLFKKFKEAVPQKLLENSNGHTQFIWPRVSHNGIVVYDNEHQLHFHLPIFDMLHQIRHRNTTFYLYTGLYCFRDALLPELQVGLGYIVL